MKKIVFILTILFLSLGLFFSLDAQAERKQSQPKQKAGIVSDNIAKLQATGINSNLSMYRNTLGRTGAYVATAIPGDSIKWTFQFDGWGGGAYSSKIVAKDNILYALEYIFDYQGASTTKVIAIDINTKRLIWEHYLPSNCYRVNAPLCVAGDFLYLSAWGQITSYDRLFALNRNTGEEVWNYDTGEYGGFYPAAVVYNDIVYFPDGNSLNALDAQTGNLLWQFDVYGISYSAPAVDPQTQSIFLAAYENANTFKVWSLDLATGEVNWQYPLRGNCYYPLVVSGNKVFVTDRYAPGPTYDDYLAFDTSSGDLLWSYNRLVNTGAFPPVVNEAENVIYVADVADLDPSARITALNMDTKEVVWSYLEQGDSWFAPILINNQLFIPCWSDKIKVFNALNGEFMKEYEAVGPYDLQEIIVADSKLVASYEADNFPDLDLIVCYQQKDKGADQIDFMEPDTE